VNTLIIVLVMTIVILVGVIVFLLIQKSAGAKFFLKAKQEAQEILKQAKEEAEKLKKEASLEAKEKFISLKTDFERQTRHQQRKLNEMERRLLRKEENLERKYQLLERKERDFSHKERALYQKEKRLQEKENEYQQKLNQVIEELERVAHFTQEEAKRELQKRIEDEARLEAVQTLRQIEEETKEKSQALAREIISQAIQRTAAEHVVETTVSIVDLPSDDMKGRIIGREGRNIRALELATGVDIIVDDTPEAVILSSFDPIRREMARMAIEKLVVDGRIHPARIEEVVEAVKEELEQKIKQEGESVILELQIQDLHPELVPSTL